MKTLLVGLLAETFIHPGSGRNSGAIDLPVVREAATDYPFIAGQSFKGALKDHARQQEEKDIELLFGKSDQGGTFRAGDIRILLLPIRSLSGSYKWATCPHLLERFLRDCRRCGSNMSYDIPLLPVNTIHGIGEGNLFLEERFFSIDGTVQQNVIDAIACLIPHEETRKRLSNQLVILSDDDFAWFARYGLAVAARNVLDEKTKESKNLWYEETLPPDTLMYSVLSESQPKGLDKIGGLMKAHPYLQAGGNETVGQGWFALMVINHSEVSHA